MVAQCRTQGPGATDTDGLLAGPPQAIPGRMGWLVAVLDGTLFERYRTGAWRGDERVFDLAIVAVRDRGGGGASLRFG
jgi:hypothetical protein